MRQIECWCVLACVVLLPQPSESTASRKRATAGPPQAAIERGPGAGDRHLTAHASRFTGRVWFAKSGGDGDGTSPSRPLGSTTAIEGASAPGDIIVLLPSDVAFNGGLALKPGQTLLGQREGQSRPAITNRSAVRNSGIGIVLADSVRVWDVRVEDTHASGIYGADVTGLSISRVDVVGANRAASSTGATMRLFETLCRDVPVPRSACAALPMGGSCCSPPNQPWLRPR